MKFAEKIGSVLEQFGTQFSWKSGAYQFNQRLLDFRKLKPLKLAKVKALQVRKPG